MKNKLLIVLIYIIGCVLSYGRWNATMIRDDTKDMRGYHLIMASTSWLGFMVGICEWEYEPFLEYE